VTALLAPLVLAIVFVTVIDLANHSVSVDEYRSNPDAGQQQSDLNGAIVFLHAVAQLALIVAGTWWTRQRPGVRLAFLFIVIPVSSLVFLLSFFGSMAK
jgi:hypothetical protein